MLGVKLLKNVQTYLDKQTNKQTNNRQTDYLHPCCACMHGVASENLIDIHSYYSVYTNDLFAHLKCQVRITKCKCLVNCYTTPKFVSGTDFFKSPL